MAFSFSKCFFFFECKPSCFSFMDTTSCSLLDTLSSFLNTTFSFSFLNTRFFLFGKEKRLCGRQDFQFFPRGCRGLIRGPLGTLIFEPAQELIHQPLKLAHLTRLWHSRMQKKRKGMFINLYASDRL